jgi:NADH:ubiquinone oxidoreductase subunit F (NADH-binding)
MHFEVGAFTFHEKAPVPVIARHCRPTHLNNVHVISRVPRLAVEGMTLSKQLLLRSGGMNLLRDRSGVSSHTGHLGMDLPVVLRCLPCAFSGGMKQVMHRLCGQPGCVQARDVFQKVLPCIFKRKSLQGSPQTRDVCASPGISKPCVGLGEHLQFSDDGRKLFVFLGAAAA